MVDIVKRFSVLACLLVISACSTKPDNELSNPQIVRSATSSLSIALAYLQLGSPTKAEPNLQKALAENPASGAVYLGYALYYQQLGDYEKAEAAFFEARQLSPPNLIPEDFVTYLCRKGEYEAATSHYTSVVSVAGERIKKSLLVDLADCYYQQGYLTEAEDIYNQSLNLPSGSNDSALLKLAELSLDKGNSSAALDYVTQFNETKEQVTPQSLLLEIKTYEALNLDDKAAQVSDMLAALFPNSDHVEQKIDVTSVEQRNEHVVSQSTETQLSNESSEPVTASLAVAEEEAKHHVLMKGETLYRVTRIYNVSLEQLKEWNPTLEANDISIGTKIYLEAHE